MVRSILISLLMASPVWAAPADLTCKPNITLSQKDVAELILKQGVRTREINLQYQQMRLAVAQARANYQWKLSATTGYLFDKSVGLQETTFDKNENLTSSVSISKGFVTGTNVGLEYKRTSFKGDLNANGAASGTLRSLSTQDLLGLNVSQNIWANFFGMADRAETDSADLNYDANMILRTNDLETLVMDTLRAFWTAYVSEQNFKETVASRDRSRRLMDAVRKKSGFGYANPGELSQSQADYESRVQAVKDASTTYLQNVDSLNTLLGLPQSCEVKFAISDVVPSVPQLPEKKIEDLRTIRSNKLLAQSAQRAFEAAASRDAPTLQLVGKLYTYGSEEDGNRAYSDMMSGAHPYYYAGIQLDYNFGQSILSESRVYRKYARDLQEARLSRVTQEAQDTLSQAQRRVQATYSGVLSTIEQKKYRERALQELNRSFSQGRTDISIYIDAMNAFSDAEIKYSRAVGDYQIALNEWAAARDELIPDVQEE